MEVAGKPAEQTPSQGAHLQIAAHGHAKVTGHIHDGWEEGGAVLSAAGRVGPVPLRFSSAPIPSTPARSHTTRLLPHPHGTVFSPDRGGARRSCLAFIPHKLHMAATDGGVPPRPVRRQLLQRVASLGCCRLHLQNGGLADQESNTCLHMCAEQRAGRKLCQPMLASHWLLSNTACAALAAAGCNNITGQRQRWHACSCASAVAAAWARDRSAAA